MAKVLARPIKPIQASCQVLIDVSATCRDDLKTGIQRVVRALVWSLIQTPPVGCRIEPVYLSCDDGTWHYRYARQWTSKVLGIADGWMSDDPVNYFDGDVLLIADLAPDLVVGANNAGVFSRLKELGVGIHFFFYDLLPIQMPQYFPPGQVGFTQWLHSLTATADSALCISYAVAKDLQSWLADSSPQRDHALGVNWFHLGADLMNSIPSTGLAPNSVKILTSLQTTTSFLMVGTIEPRKGYLQTLKAFTRLWQSGLNINLVIVGREGWVGLPENQRQSISEIVSLIQSHPELGKRLQWLTEVSDEYLVQLYANSDCLIAASEGEGFGLPLIEAAQHALPIIARDITVFKEVAGDCAFYFNGLEVQDLACAIEDWLVLEKEKKQPFSQSMPWLTWAQSTMRVIELLQLVSKHESMLPRGETQAEPS
jgi:glycosyltransferase involved in cell wall biosynthesis